MSTFLLCFLTPGHRLSAQTRLLRRPLPAVHVQHRVQENPPYVHMCIRVPRLASVVTYLCPPFPVKPSPSKKSRGGGQGGLRRAPTLGGPTPLSHATGQPGVDSKFVYHSHFKSTESEAEGGKTSSPHRRFVNSSF